MARPIYPYESGDPDFSWLLTNFQENHPDYTMIQSGTLPVVFINCLPMTYVDQEKDGFIKDAPYHGAPKEEPTAIAKNK